MSREEREEFWLAMLMASVAGMVDAIGFLTLFKVFTSHMSGNTSGMGVYTALGDWSEAFRRFFPIPIFFIGTALGALLAEIGVRNGLRTVFALALSVEAVLLAAFLAYGVSLSRHGVLQTDDGWRFYLLVALPALAMGLQNASLRRVGRSTVHTTYITGALTDAAEAAIAHAYWIRDQSLGFTWRDRLKLLTKWRQQATFRRLALFSGIWLVYAIGALFGAYVRHIWGLGALGFPLAGLAALILWELLWPIKPSTIGETPKAQRRSR